MGKRIGIWDESVNPVFEFAVVSHENYEYFEFCDSENLIEGHERVFKLKESVKKNPEVFAWYIANNSSSNLEVDIKCCDSASGYLIHLFQEFFHSLNELNIERCKQLKQFLSKIDFRSYYLYRASWLLDELLEYAKILQEAFLRSSPISFVTESDYRFWWNQPLSIQRCLEDFDRNCSLESLQDISSLKSLIDLKERLASGLSKWSNLRSLERLEAASGYFLALAEYYFKIKNYQMCVLYAHRSMDCVLGLLGYRENLILATRGGLSDDRGNRISYSSTLKALDERSNVIFSSSEISFLKKINTCRNYLLEVHGFRVVGRQEAYEFLAASRNYLRSLDPEVKSHEYRVEFDIRLKLPLKAIFEVERGFDSYISPI